MRVVLNLSFDCNLKCEYCYVHKQKEIYAHNTGKHSAKEWIDGLNWLQSVYEPIRTIDISGGEPFLYDGILDIINAIPNNMEMGITTNALRVPNEFFSFSGKKCISVTISAHLNSEGKLPEKFIMNARKIKTHFPNSNINFVLYKNQLDRIDYVRGVADELGIRFHGEPYIDYNEIPRFGEETLSQEVKNLMSKRDLTPIECSLKRELPSDCYIGSSFLWITPDGNLNQCMGRLMAGKEPLGNLFEKKIYRQPQSPLKCDLFCPCAQNWRD